LQQISRLQRKKVLQSTVEAEREHYITEIADLKKQVGELLEDLHRQQQSSAQYKQQRAEVEESLYQKIKMLGDEKNYYKAEVSRLQVDIERHQQENHRLRKAQITLDVELMRTRQGTQEAHSAGSSAAAAQIEALKMEIAEWKDKVGSQRELEAQKDRFEANCKKLEMKLSVSEQTNRSLNQRVNQLTMENTNGYKPQAAPQNQPKFRSFLDSVAKNHSAELAQLQNSHDALVRQYRSLEETYRSLLLSRESERRERLQHQQSNPSLVSENSYPRGLLDDGLSVDSRHKNWDQQVVTPEKSSPAGSDSGPDTVTGQPTGPIPMVESISGRPNVTSPIDNNPFAAMLPRRNPSSSAGSLNKPQKIKSNSEIRIYGRYAPPMSVSDFRGGAQNIGMKPKKEKKTGLALG
jgi:hypothetical protein